MTVKTVTAAIILKRNTVLITRRGPGEKLAGFWEFPGGKIEEGETPQECLERELLEELGVSSTATEIIAESEYLYAHGAIRLLAILTTLRETRFTLKVHDQYSWAPLGTLLQYKLAPADIPIATMLVEKKNELFAGFRRSAAVNSFHLDSDRTVKGDET
ncbi:MAG: (deoxy)nucleoside triphosphate pyrophosphohydrolase [Thermodesulfobacteriota bacterium]